MILHRLIKVINIYLCKNFFPDPCTPHWNSKALSDRPDALVSTFEEFDISNHIGDLRMGTKVLAIHGLNFSANDPNFLILPELIMISTPGLNTYTNALAPLNGL